jgi:hypothetical protein
MGWIFSLSAECGAEQSEAEKFAEHFQEIAWVLSNGIQSHSRASIFQDLEENWWCRVCPSAITEIRLCGERQLKLSVWLVNAFVWIVKNAN